MYTASVEIYSDETNAAIMRHPGRRFPGFLVQGDSLHALCVLADAACEKAKSSTAYDDLNRLRNALWANLNHYKTVLGEHEIPLPFSEDLPYRSG